MLTRIYSMQKGMNIPAIYDSPIVQLCVFVLGIFKKCSLYEYPCCVNNPYQEITDKHQVGFVSVEV